MKTFFVFVCAHEPRPPSIWIQIGLLPVFGLTALWSQLSLSSLIKTMKGDVLRRTILELVKKGHVYYTDIENKAVATCLRFATSNTIRKQFYHYLLPNGYVERASRGVYRITQKGEKLLEILM